MSFESLIAVSQRLSVSVDALSAVGAQLRLQQDEFEADSRVRALLNNVSRAVDPQLFEGVERHHRAAALALIQTIFRQALDLLENPERADWSYQDARARERHESGVAKRVEFRSHPVEQLKDASSFTLAWLPGPFIAAEIADRALERIHQALVPGGCLIFGLNAPPGGPLEEALASLRMVRSGGHPWTPKEVEEKLQAHGFEQIEVYSPVPPILFVAGRRAASLAQ
jgi:hypothetical protein